MEPNRMREPYVSHTIQKSGKENVRFIYLTKVRDKKLECCQVFLSRKNPQAAIRAGQIIKQHNSLYWKLNQILTGPLPVYQNYASE